MNHFDLSQDNFLKCLLNSIDEQVFILSEQGIFLKYYQDAGRFKLFLPPAQFLGKHFRHVLPRHVAKRLTTAINSIAGLEDCLRSFDYLMELAGQEVWFEARVTAIYGEKLKILAYVLVLRDISKRKTAEIELKRYAKDLENLTRHMIEKEKEIVRLREELRGYQKNMQDSA